MVKKRFFRNEQPLIHHGFHAPTCDSFKPDAGKRRVSIDVHRDGITPDRDEALVFPLHKKRAKVCRKIFINSGHVFGRHCGE